MGEAIPTIAGEREGQDAVWQVSKHPGRDEGRGPMSLVAILSGATEHRRTHDKPGATELTRGNINPASDYEVFSGTLQHARAAERKTTRMRSHGPYSTGGGTDICLQ